MIETASLAGFWTAHGIWSVSDGETLIPLIGYQQPHGEGGMDRYMLGDIGESARAAQEALELNEIGASRAVLVADAYVTLESVRTDALVVEAVTYGLEPCSISMAVPYRPATDPAGFAVHRPVFFEVTGPDQPDLDVLADAFFAGVDSHEQASEVWTAHLEQDY